ncbi:hypothetical protein Tco_0323594 [Tanacetum coccineum]
MKFSTHDDEERHNEEDIQEEGSDLRVLTPSYYESTDDEDNDEEIQGANVEEEEMDEEETNEEEEEEEVDKLYRGVNVNLEGRDTKMTDAPCTIVQTTQVIEATHVIITLVNPEGQQQSSSVSSGFISNMLNPSPDTAASSIPGIVDTHLANKMNEAVKTVEQVKEQVKAQVSKILPKIKKTVNEQLEAEVLTRSSNESKTSYAVATNLSKLELKKILIDKMERNKSIHRSNKQKNLYKALDDDEEPFAGSNGGSKRRRARKELESISKPKEKTSKSLGKSKEGSKSHHKSAGESTQAEEPMHIAKDLEELAHQEFKTGVTEDQADEETS